MTEQHSSLIRLHSSKLVCYSPSLVCTRLSFVFDSSLLVRTRLSFIFTLLYSPLIHLHSSCNSSCNSSVTKWLFIAKTNKQDKLMKIRKNLVIIESSLQTRCSIKKSLKTNVCINMRPSHPFPWFGYVYILIGVPLTPQCERNH